MSYSAYDQKGVSGDVRLGKRGPRIIDSSGVVQHRNATNTAFARAQGASPTVGDDFTTKGYVDGLLGALPSMDIYDSTGGTVVPAGPASWVDVPFDTNRQIDTQFTHTGSNAEFIWNGVSGTKVNILGKVGVLCSISGTTIRSRLMLDTGSGFNPVSGTLGQDDLSSAGSEGSCVTDTILTLNNGDRVKIQAQHSNSGAIALLLANASSLVAFAMQAPAVGTGSSFDNRGAPITSPVAAASGGTADFDIPLGLPFGHAIWFRLESVAGSVGGKIEIFADSSRTKQIYFGNLGRYDSNNNFIPEPLLIEGTPWAAIADDGSNLESDTLYCRVTNDGTVASTYTMEMRFEG